MSIYSILIDLDTLKNINEFICKTSDTPEEHSNVINEANLLSALSVLDSYFETPEETAAALLRSLIIAHGFEQGNKRTAFIASMMICPCSCSHKEAADITLKIATGEIKDVKMIAKKLFKLDEDLFVDVPEVEYQLDTNIELEGPKPGEDVGVSGLLLDLIGKVASDINDLNQLQANLENYPEIAELIKDFADEENVKLGKIQSALKTISPNAEYIMNGAVEAEQEMDPDSPLDESFKEDWRTNKAKLDWNKLNKLCSYIFDESQNVKEYCSFKYKDNYLLVSTLLDGYHLNSKASRDFDEESKIRSRCKEKGIHCRISPIYHRDSFDSYEGIEVQLRVPYDLISRDKFLDNESLKEDFDPKSYNQALDDYMSSENISVEKLFGTLKYDDPRYIQLFNSLKDLGYKPRETGTYPRGYFIPAMTITVPTKEIPDDVINLIDKLGGVTGRHVGFHRGVNDWKLKFELRDDDFSSFKDNLFHSMYYEQSESEDDFLDESLEDCGLKLLNNGVEIEGLGDLYYDEKEDIFYEIKYIPGHEFRNNINEAYDSNTIKDYFEDAWNNYSKLRDSLYAFENSVSGISDLEIAASTFIRNIEEAAGEFWTDYDYYISSEELKNEI